MSKGRQYFRAQAPAGRRITAGFSYLHRIDKASNLDVWFPKAFRDELDKTRAEGRRFGASDFPAQWAAIRQFELLQEAGNYKVYDLEATHLTRSLVDQVRNMRAGGYRIIVVSVGRYEVSQSKDDLAILDYRLEQRLSTLLHTLYLEQESERINSQNEKKLKDGNWDYRAALPHVGVTLGARDLFRPISRSKKSSGAELRHQDAQLFFDIVEQLPQKHIVHDTALGLQLPDANKEHENIYVPLGEHSFHAFSRLLVDLFSPFDDKVNMRALQGEVGAAPDVVTTMHHMRGYGFRLSQESDHHYGQLARFGLS